MADIVKGDGIKRSIRLAMWWLRRKIKKDYGVDSEQIHNDMQYCGNLLIREIHQRINIYADNIKQDYHKSTIKDFGEMGLWIIYKDTAYRDPFFYMIKHLVDWVRQNPKEFDSLIEKYYKEPKDWYVNAHDDTMKHTKQLKDDGKMTDYHMAYDETIFVPSEQKKRFNSIIGKEMDDEIKKEKQRRRW